MKFWLKALVSFGALGILLTFLPWQELRDAASRLSLGVWTGVLLGFVAGHCLGILKWRALVNVGRASLGLIDAAKCYAAGLFANLCLPSIVGGDVLRAALAGKRTGRPEASVLGGIADRLIDLLTLGLLSGAGLVLVGSAHSEWAPWSLYIGLPFVASGTLMMFIVMRRPLARWPGRYRRVIGRGQVALRRLRRNPAVAFKAFLVSVLIQSGFVLLNAWIGLAIGIVLPLGVWFLAWPLAKLAGLLPISLGGLGTRDATLAALLVPFGVPAAYGLVASLIWQTVLIGGGLLGGLASWLLGWTGEREARGGADIAVPGSSSGSNV